MNRRGRLSQLLLRFLNPDDCTGHVRFQVGYVAFQFANRLLLLAGLRLSRIRLAGGVVSGALCLLCDLVLAVQFLSQFLDLLLLLCYRCLLRCDRVLQLLDVSRSNGRRRSLFGGSRGCAGLCHQRRRQK